MNLFFILLRLIVNGGEGWIVQRDGKGFYIHQFEDIMMQYGTDVKRFIFTYVKDWDVASDLTQDVFIKVYHSLQQFEYRSSLKTWIFSIAANRSKDYLKSWHYRHLTFNEKFFSKRASGDKNPEQQLLQNAENQSMLTKVQSLPIKYKEVIFLYYYGELTTSEISALLNTSVSTVKTRLLRGKQLLKKYFPEEAGGEINEYI